MSNSKWPNFHKQAFQEEESGSLRSNITGTVCVTGSQQSVAESSANSQFEKSSAFTVCWVSTLLTIANTIVNITFVSRPEKIEAEFSDRREIAYA